MFSSSAYHSWPKRRTRGSRSGVITICDPDKIETIGSALLGKRVGEEARVDLPDEAEVVFIIKKIEKAD